MTYVPYEQRPGTTFPNLDQCYRVIIDITKRNGKKERRWVGTIWNRIYQFKGQRLRTMSFNFYGTRCVSLSTQEWEYISHLCDWIELVDTEDGLVWRTTTQLAAKYGMLRETPNGARYLINLGAFASSDRHWNEVRRATLL